MSTNRKIVFANDEIYHVFNRGIELRSTFTDKREFIRAVETLSYYRFAYLPLRLSKSLVLAKSERSKLIQKITSEYQKLIEIICYCLMPNHFHFLLKQKMENGISIFTSNFTNSYTKYFNTRHERVGPLFQGVFKAVHVESDEQLIHVSRYIHLNPVSSYIIEPDQLDTYKWSSFPQYIDLNNRGVTDSKIVLNFFPSKKNYKEFVLDQVDYARKLEVIKHLTLE